MFGHYIYAQKDTLIACALILAQKKCYCWGTRLIAQMLRVNNKILMKDKYLCIHTHAQTHRHTHIWRLEKDKVNTYSKCVYICPNTYMLTCNNQLHIHTHMQRNIYMNIYILKIKQILCYKKVWVNSSIEMNIISRK